MPARLVRFQGSGHGISVPSKTALPYEVYGAQEQLIWFRRYLMPAQ